ncbi:peptidoglycan-associated lipoprotein [candidate division BRC1 bacterium HGW-BRC1-1]|nr:MAG: peptidoglycan-associated lipoprotein [candidate division BRC1 bacterium HGW-BRC1-1]
MKTFKAVKLLLLFMLIAIVATGCRGCSKGKMGQMFGRNNPDAAGMGIDSSILPEPIRGETPMEIAELGRVYYEFDSASLLEPAKQQLQLNAQWMQSQPQVHIQVEGHCDERGTSDYNYALGQRRADTVRNYLINVGIDPARLHTISYGADRPDDPEHNDTAWARNRRVQFLVYSGR